MAIKTKARVRRGGISKQREAALIRAAIKAREGAYCPYSNYRVGASVLGASGRIYTGCNVENSSYGLTVCAERVAILKAVSEGERELKAVCVAAKSARPCGACRQVMAEFLPMDSPVIIVNLEPEDRPVVLRAALAKILPMAFDPADAGL